MSWIEWKESYRLGIPSVDYEHQELIALLNDLYEQMQHQRSEASLSDFLGEVYARISSHFALEERVMREQHYDQFSEHKAAHEDLLDEIRDIMDEQEAGDDTAIDQALAERLQAWFTQHFSTHDARLHSRIGGGDLSHGEI